MGYCSYCALVLSPEGEKALQSAVQEISASVGEIESEDIRALVDDTDEKYECEGCTLRIWCGHKWYLEFSEIAFLEDFLNDHWNEHRYLRYGEDLGDYDKTGGFNDDPFEIGINTEFSFRKPHSTQNSTSSFFERHSNGLMVLKMVDVSLSHITLNDVELLNTQSSSNIADYPVVYPKDSGYFVLVDDDDLYEEGLRSFGYSEAFLQLFMKGRETGAAWLELDADGTECPSLQKFEHN